MMTKGHLGLLLTSQCGYARNDLKRRIARA